MGPINLLDPDAAAPPTEESSIFLVPPFEDSPEFKAAEKEKAFSLLFKSFVGHYLLLNPDEDWIYAYSQSKEALMNLRKVRVLKGYVVTFAGSPEHNLIGL